MAELRERIAFRFKRLCTYCAGWPEGETCAACREEAGVVIGLTAKWLREQRVDVRGDPNELPHKTPWELADELADEMEGR